MKPSDLPEVVPGSAFDAALKRALSAPAGPCLTEDEIIGHAFGLTSTVERAETEGHLVSCVDCAEAMVELIAATDHWEGSQDRLTQLLALESAAQAEPALVTAANAERERMNDKSR